MTARNELTNYLGRVAQGGLVTVDGADGVVFHVGDTDFAKGKGLGSNKLKDEEWVIRSFGRDVVLNGGGTRGCLYAVSHFLEDQCGVRWWFEGEEDVPAAKPLAFGKLDRRGRPVWRHRNIYRGGRKAGLSPQFAVRNRLNVNGEEHIPAEWGGDDQFGPPYHCGAFERLLPFAECGAAHPEWYSLVGGKRLGGYKRGQLCLTCPGLVDVLADRLESYIAQGRAEAAARGLPPPRLYSVTPNDNKNLCQCDGCRAEREAYGASGFHLRFLNRVASKLGARHPEILFSFNAYHDSETVPKAGVRAADNILVLIANTRQNMTSGIFAPENAHMRDCVRDWKGFARHLGVWEYAVTYMSLTKGFPFPSEFYIPERYRYYAEQGARTVMLEHEYPGESDMYELKYHLERKALEDPFGPGADILIPQFMRDYYGEASGAKILEARQHLNRICRERHASVKWSPNFSEFGFFRLADIEHMEALFDAAEAVAAGEKHLRRVRRARAGLDRFAQAFRKASVLHEPEAGVADRPFCDFPVNDRDGSWYVYNQSGKDPNLQFTDDARAPSGRAVRINADASDYYKLPFLFGIKDTRTQKVAYSGLIEAAQSGEGYQWYDFRDVSLPESGYFIFLTRSWAVRLPATPPTLCGTVCDVRVLIDFQGPLYNRRGTENRILISRLVFIPKGERK